MYNPKLNDILFFGVIISFLLGTILAIKINPSPFVYIVMAIGVFISFLILFTKKRQVSFLILVFFLVSMIGVLRASLFVLHQEEIKSSIVSQNTYTAVVVREPEYFSNYQRFVARVISQDKKFKVLVTTNRYPEFYFGDVVSISGFLEKPENFTTNSGREFDYISYLEKDSIYFRIPSAHVVGTGEEKLIIRKKIFEFKQHFLDAIARIIPDPESSLLSGVLLGVKQSLGDELEQNFIDTGTIHIVVLSGYNVTIVSEALVRSFQNIMSGNIALGFGAFGIVLFAILTGASTTTVRASIMGLLGLLARVTNRTYQVLRVLGVSAFAMVLWNPLIIVHDVSFQLSFIATLGLILVTPIFESFRWVKFIPEKFGLRSILSSTLATQFTVLPFLLYKIGTLSIVSPLVNMLILPFVPVTMGFGFLAGIFEMVTHVGSNPLAWISYGLLTYAIKVVNLFASFSWSSVFIPEIPVVFVIFLYSLLAVFVFKFRKKLKL